jgi:hypothetical protein
MPAAPCGTLRTGLDGRITHGIDEPRIGARQGDNAPFGPRARLHGPQQTRGELKAYTALLNESRAEAMERMVEEARTLGANAVINIRFSTSNIAAGAAEVMAYGTAVIVS